VPETLASDQLFCWRSGQGGGLVGSQVSHVSAVKVNVKADIARQGNPISELRDVTCHMRSHSVTCHPTQVNVPRLIPAMQVGTRFSYPGGMEG